MCLFKKNKFARGRKVVTQLSVRSLGAIVRAKALSKPLHIAMSGLRMFQRAVALLLALSAGAASTQLRAGARAAI
jgi:hypothetical protein